VSQPSEGPGSPAGFGRRLLAFIVDAALSVLIAVLSGHRPSVEVHGQAHPSLSYNLIVAGSFLAIEFLFVSLVGQTPGMRLARIVVVRAADRSRPPVQWVLVRTLLLATLVPALLNDSSGRALHDRAAGTATLRLR